MARNLTLKAYFAHEKEVSNHIFKPITFNNLLKACFSNKKYIL